MKENKIKDKTEQDNSLVDSKTESRRKMLRSVLASSGVLTTAAFIPDRWVTPKIDSVVIPAHAQTTSEEDAEDFALLAAGMAFSNGGQPIVSNGVIDDGLLIAEQDNSDDDFWDSLTDQELLDFFVRPAHADHCDSNTTISLQVCLDEMYASFSIFGNGPYHAFGFASCPWFNASGAAIYDGRTIESPTLAFSSEDGSLQGISIDDCRLTANGNSLECSGSLMFDTFSNTTTTFEFTASCDISDYSDICER